MTTTQPPIPAKKKFSPRERLTALRTRFLAGADPAENPELVVELAAAEEEVRALDLAEAAYEQGATERKQARAASERDARREVAIVEAQKLVEYLPGLIDDAYRRTALVELWDLVSDYRQKIAEAVHLLDAARVPYLARQLGGTYLPSDGEYAGDLDEANCIVGNPYEVNEVRLAGRKHVPAAADPGTWVRAAVRNAARQRDGMPTHGFAAPSGPLERAVGNVSKPHLPRID